MMVDQSRTGDSDTWDPTLASTTVNHSTDGVNALFVDGHVEWVPKGRITERIPNRNITGDGRLRSGA